MDYWVKHRKMYQVCYTLCKYLDKVDLSGIANVNALAFRYLSCNLIALKEYFDKRGKKC